MINYNCNEINNFTYHRDKRAKTLRYICSFRSKHLIRVHYVFTFYYLIKYCIREGEREEKCARVT